MTKLVLTVERPAFTETELTLVSRIKKTLIAIFDAQSVTQEMKEEEQKRQ